MSWNDDNTVPLNDFGEGETSLNVGLEDDDNEDYIPTSQPRREQSMSSLESFVNKKVEETIPDEEYSLVEETIPVLGNEVFDSPDFIPATEKKPRRSPDDFKDSPDSISATEKKTRSHDQPENAEPESSDDNTSHVKFSEDIFTTQTLQVPGSPTIIDSQMMSVVNETEADLSNVENDDADVSKDILVSDASVTEIFDHDVSRETINLDSGRNSKVLETQDLSSDTDKEKTPTNVDEIINVDSPLRFTEMSATLPVLNSQQLEGELPDTESKKSEGLSNDTIDANGADEPPFSPFPARCDTDLAALSKLPSLSNGNSSAEEIDRLSKKSSTGSSARNKVFEKVLADNIARIRNHSTPESTSSKEFNQDDSASSIENSTPHSMQDASPSSQASDKVFEVTFHLKVQCQAVYDADSKKIKLKKIDKVYDMDKGKIIREKAMAEALCTDDKSKRSSSSSVGSVFSDQAPFKLQRQSVLTTQTESSGSVDGLELAYKEASRLPWVNEFKIGLLMDDNLHLHISNLDWFNDRNRGRTPLSTAKAKARRKFPERNLSSVSESTNGTNTEDFLSPQTNVSDQSNRFSTKEKSNLTEDNDSMIGEPDIEERNEEPEFKTPPPVIAEKLPVDEKESDGSDGEEPQEDLSDNRTPEKRKVDESDQESEADQNSESESEELQIGTSVFARWTDLNYYPGKIHEQAKLEKWNIRFDDGTTKVIKEDFILPLKWIKEGELVFALVDGTWESGKITKVNRGKVKEFTVELDDINLEVSVNRIDIRLTETMAGIVREKYKPVSEATPKPKSISDINCGMLDNVVSGKRVRELATPTRPSPAQTASSRKKNSSTKQTDQKTPVRGSTKKTDTPVGSRSTGRARKPKTSESSNPQEDESPARSSKNSKPKGNAKSLKGEFEKLASPLPVVPEEPAPGASGAKKKGRPPSKSTDSPAAAGEPVPGPSGVKRKKKAEAVKAGSTDSPLAVPVEEPAPGPSVVKRGRGRPRLTSLNEEKSSAKKADVNKEDEVNVPVTESRKGKRKLKLTEEEPKEAPAVKKTGKASKKK